MKTELMIFEGHEVETLELNGEILFNPYHVGACLDMANGTVKDHMSRMSKRQVVKLTNSEVGLTNFRKLNNAGENFLTESGVYKLVFKSRKSNAEKFTDWIADEVLPTLRKTGTYTTNTTYQYAVSPAAGAAAAELGRVTRNIMRDQGSSPYKIAATFKLECEQLGIELPADFVEIPVYQQLSFQDTIIG